MAFRLSKEQATQRNELTAPALSSELYSRISSLVQDAKTFCDDVASEMRGMFDEKSERWRRDRRVDQEFENLDLEELSEPDESGVDALEAIDDRRPSKVTP